MGAGAFLAFAGAFRPEMEPALLSLAEHVVPVAPGQAAFGRFLPVLARNGSAGTAIFALLS